MLSDRERIEVDYWRDSPDERPGPLLLPNILNKMHDAERFAAFFPRFRPLYRGRVLELGGGQGWASCLAKRMAPEAHVTATDISPYAIASLPHWERLWSVKVDHSYACRATSIPERTGSVDLVWCFASAHHFDDMPAALSEMRRVLRPTGAALFLYEPAAPKYLYRLQKWRANRIRPAVPEDVLVPSVLRAQARAAGLSLTIHDCLSAPARGPLATAYYGALQAMPPLSRVLPCAIHVMLRPAE
jgi:SAM-dependent methyltransferase